LPPPAGWVAGAVFVGDEDASKFDGDIVGGEFVAAIEAAECCEFVVNVLVCPR
jgi:hypothetical protein